MAHERDETSWLDTVDAVVLTSAAAVRLDAIVAVSAVVVVVDVALFASIVAASTVDVAAMDSSADSATVALTVSTLADVAADAPSLVKPFIDPSALFEFVDSMEAASLADVDLYVSETAAAAAASVSRLFFQRFHKIHSAFQGGNLSTSQLLAATLAAALALEEECVRVLDIAEGVGSSSLVEQGRDRFRFFIFFVWMAEQIIY